MLNISNFLNQAEKEIFKKYENRIPFRVVEFANDIGFEVFEDDLPDNISGKIEKRLDGTFAIYLNSKNSPSRQVFTIAHELGHYFRHREYFDNNSTLEEPIKPLYNTFQKDRNNYSEEENQREKEANEFAVELLMPEIIIKQKYSEFGSSLSKMARYFNVSEMSMAFRIENIFKPSLIDVA